MFSFVNTTPPSKTSQKTPYLLTKTLYLYPSRTELHLAAKENRTTRAGTRSGCRIALQPGIARLGACRRTGLATTCKGPQKAGGVQEAEDPTFWQKQECRIKCRCSRVQGTGVLSSLQMLRACMGAGVQQRAMMARCRFRGLDSKPGSSEDAEQGRWAGVLVRRAGCRRQGGGSRKRKFGFGGFGLDGFWDFGLG
ncbi:hypothetical protein SLEP1_g42762 [Rubroshorea leprosula]|uniref:Uncharacterized protein n=1 Tax=Rubroshorea leprosula TaxID=152421 RepID=A0AAV5LBJ7_9ROSI|nr:hypothetical protein SLEP1_g42762 [Rubroshorea leprosula]